MNDANHFFQKEALKNMNLSDITMTEANYKGQNYLTKGHIKGINVLVYDSADFECVISLQGAQLLHWRPKNQANIIFTSPDAQFFKGQAIRGGVPICWPWFGKKSLPMHGFARIIDWDVAELHVDANQLDITFTLSNNEETSVYLSEPFIVSLQCSINVKSCDLKLSYLSDSKELDGVTAALHTYFEVADIESTQVIGLGNTCLNTINNMVDVVQDPRQFDQKIDCIYPAPAHPTVIKDIQNKRAISVSHQSSNVVVWNPWENLPDMSFLDSKKMLCVESAYIDETMKPKQVLQHTISYCDV